MGVCHIIFSACLYVYNISKLKMIFFLLKQRGHGPGPSLPALCSLLYLPLLHLISPLMNDCLPQHVQISSTPVLPNRQRLTSPLEGGNLSHLSLSVRQLWESRAYLGFGTQSDQGLKFDFVTSCDLSSLGYLPLSNRPKSPPVLGVPKTPAGFSDLQGGLLGLSAELYSGLGFITGKGCRAKSAKGRGTWGRVWKRPAASFPATPPSGVTRTHLIHSALNCDSMGEVSSTMEAH